MDQFRFDALTRLLGARPSRRGLLQSLAGIGIAVLTSVPFGTGNVDAKKKHRRKKKKKAQPVQPVFNQFGCLDVGQPCGGDASLCCSGICEGLPPQKGKPDTRVCAAHGTGTCDQTLEGVCTTTNLVLATCNNRTDCGCFRTTAGSNYCAELFGGPGASQCVPCQRDADCVALGLPAESACAPVSAGRCAGFCPGGMACLVPCGPKPAT